MEITNEQIAAMTDLTLLKAEATESEVDALCAAAIANRCYGVCVNLVHAFRAAELLRSTSVRVVTVIGFPLGATVPGLKVSEAEVVEGVVDELDMVMSIGAFIEGNYKYVQQDIADVVKAAIGRPVKVIIESAALVNVGEIERACHIAEQAGAAYVKTSTGFHPNGGATVEAVAKMRATVWGKLGIKASGGIRTPEDARKMIAAGATRIGASSPTVFGR